LGSVITLTTDFAARDGYQAVLEGIIAGINPRAKVITITHDLEPGDVAGGWYLLKTHYRYFPPRTVHLAIVDPGVGGRRKMLAVQTAAAFMIGPDNGLLSFIPRREIISIRSITNRKYALSQVSPVFQGRDIMAPAAAYLSLGIDPACLGPKCRAMVALPKGKPARTRLGIKGGILWIDRFGNLISTIEADLAAKGKDVMVDGTSIGPLRRTFSDVRSGEPVAYIGSGGHLEIAVRDGSALEFFSACRGDDTEILVVASEKRR